MADQSTCAGVGVGVTDGEGNSAGVEKVGPVGLLLGDGPLIGTGMSWGRIVVTLAGVVAAAAACAPAFVFAVVFVPFRAFVPVCVVPVELPLELPSPPAAAPVIPTVGLLSPVCAPAFIPVCAPAFVLGAVIVLLREFVPSWAALVELPLKPLSPAAGPPMIPPVGLLIPVCAPAFIPMCAPALVFGTVIVLLRKFVPSCAALVELPLKPLCPAIAPVVVPV